MNNNELLKTAKDRLYEGRWMETEVTQGVDNFKVYCFIKYVDGDSLWGSHGGKKIDNIRLEFLIHQGTGVCSDILTYEMRANSVISDTEEEINNVATGNLTEKVIDTMESLAYKMARLAHVSTENTEYIYFSSEVKINGNSKSPVYTIQQYIKANPEINTKIYFVEWRGKIYTKDEFFSGHELR